MTQTQDTAYKIISDSDTLTISITAQDKGAYDAWLQAVQEATAQMDGEKRIETQEEKQKRLWAKKQKVSERVVDIFERDDLRLKIWERDGDRRIYIGIGGFTQEGHHYPSEATYYQTGNDKTPPATLELDEAYEEKRADVLALMQEIARGWKKVEIECNMMTDETRARLDEKARVEKERKQLATATERAEPARLMELGFLRRYPAEDEYYNIVAVERDPHSGISRSCMFACRYDSGEMHVRVSDKSRIDYNFGLLTPTSPYQPAYKTFLDSSTEASVLTKGEVADKIKAIFTR